MEIHDQQAVLKILNAISDPVLLVCNQGSSLAANATFSRRYSNQLTSVFSRDSLVLFKNMCKQAWQSGLEEGAIVSYDQLKKPHLVNMVISRLTLLSGTVLLTHWKDKPVFSTVENAAQEAEDLLALAGAAQGPQQDPAELQEEQKEKAVMQRFFPDSKIGIDHIVDDWPMPTYVLDPQGKILHGNRIFARSMGIDYAELRGKSFRDSKSLPLATLQDMEAIHQYFLNSPVPDVVNLSFAYPNGSPMKTRAYVTPVHDHDNVFVGLVVLLVDQTEEHYLQEVLRISEERWQLAVNATSSGFCDYIHASKTIFCSKGVTDLFHLEQGGLEGKDLTYFVNLITDESLTQKQVILRFLEGTSSEETLTLDTHMHCGQEDRWVRWRLLTMRQESNGELWRTVIVFSDMNEQKQYEKELAERAYLDALTQLPNRVSFKKKLASTLADLEEGDFFAVIVLDLDGFKAVNDTRGHQAGDHLLQIVASRILESIGLNDFAARVGGDEFFLILQDIKTKEEAVKRCQTVLESLELPIEMVDSEEAYVSASVGVAYAPMDSDDMTTIMRYADQAMYHAKKTGKHRVYEWNATLEKEGEA
ncbi:MAG: diguanylate cyclase domain-containing protein [Spirochaetia bacterium]